MTWKEITQQLAMRLLALDGITWRPFAPPGDVSMAMILTGIAEQEFSTRRAVDRVIMRHFHDLIEIEDQTVAYFTQERYAAALRLSQLMQEPGPFLNRSCSLDEKLLWLLIETWQTQGLTLWTEAMTTHAFGLRRGIWIERRDPRADLPSADDIWLNTAGVNAVRSPVAQLLQTHGKDNLGSGLKP